MIKIRIFLENNYRSFTAETLHAPQPRIKDIGDAHIVGETLKLVCEINFEVGVLVNITWDYPRGILQNDPRLRIVNPPTRNHPTKVDYQITSKILILENLKKSDSGTFTCDVRDHLNHSKIDSTDIRVLGEFFKSHSC